MAGIGSDTTAQLDEDAVKGSPKSRTVLARAWSPQKQTQTPEFQHPALEAPCEVQLPQGWALRLGVSGSGPCRGPFGPVARLRLQPRR
eukprot:10844926-Alexandrium_andersonii.AAC.1